MDAMRIQISNLTHAILYRLKGTAMDNADITVAADQMKPLVGGRIIDTVITPDSDSYGFVVRKGDETKVCWVDCDSEGNGPGWIAIQERKADV